MKAYLTKAYTKGLTIIEMLVALSIFFIITSIVMFNHGKFNSSIVITNLAHEVAIAVRQAQVYGLAVKQNPNSPESFEYAYGVYFIQGAKVFYIFADIDGDQQFDPDGDPCLPNDEFECEERIEITGDIIVDSLTTTINTDYLTILFLRPNPVAIIRDQSNSSASSNGRKRATIELYSAKAEKSKEIVVELSGQVSVQD